MQGIAGKIEVIAKAFSYIVKAIKSLLYTYHNTDMSLGSQDFKSGDAHAAEV